MKRSGPLLLGAAVILVGLTACNTIHVYDAWMSPDGDGSRHRSVFLSDSENINAIAMYSSGRKDATLTASIVPTSIDQYYECLYPDEPSVLPGAEIEEVSSAGPQQILTVQLTKGDPPVGSTYGTEEPWTPGTYRVDFLVDGEVQKSTNFSIEFHDCPTQRPNNLTPCYPLYRKSNVVAQFQNDPSSYQGCDYSDQVSEAPGSFVCACADWSPVDPSNPTVALEQPDPTDPTKGVPIVETIWTCGSVDNGTLNAVTPGFISAVQPAPSAGTCDN